MKKTVSRRIEMIKRFEEVPVTISVTPKTGLSRWLGAYKELPAQGFGAFTPDYSTHPLFG
jgi:hypothetical protein